MPLVLVFSAIPMILVALIEAVSAVTVARMLAAKRRR